MIYLAATTCIMPMSGCRPGRTAGRTNRVGPPHIVVFIKLSAVVVFVVGDVFAPVGLGSFLTRYGVQAVLGSFGLGPDGEGRLIIKTL
jgi:hypothetical protein